MFKEKKNYRDQDICETKQTIQNLKRKINYYKENLKKIKLQHTKNLASFYYVIDTLKHNINKYKS